MGWIDGFRRLDLARRPDLACRPDFADPGFNITGIFLQQCLLNVLHCSIKQHVTDTSIQKWQVLDAGMHADGIQSILRHIANDRQQRTKQMKLTMASHSNSRHYSNNSQQKTLQLEIRKTELNAFARS